VTETNLQTFTWKDTIKLQRSGSIPLLWKEISDVLDLVSQHEESIKRSWNEFFEH